MVIGSVQASLDEVRPSKVRPGSLWEVDMGATRERVPSFCLWLQSPTSLGLYGFCSLPLPQPPIHFSLCSQDSSAYSWLVCSAYPLLQLVYHRVNHDHDSIQPQMPITI